MTPDSSRFTEQFKNPPASCRILKINHGWPGTEAARQQQVDDLLKNGFGGFVNSINFGGGYVTSSANWDAMRGGIAAIRKAGLDLWLYDEAGYPSGRAGGLVLEGHPEREAHALLATTQGSEINSDGLMNVGPLAKVTASSTDKAGGSYKPENVNNGAAAPLDWNHWTNDPATDPSSRTKPVWLTLEWDSPVAVKQIVFHTMRGYEAQDYTIEYMDNGMWRQFADADVSGNRDVQRRHVARQAVKTSQIRFLGEKGPAQQEGIVRVVELEVLTPAGKEPEVYHLPMPPGKLLLAKAFKMDKQGGILLKSAIDLPTPVDNKIDWTAPKGRWQLLAVSEDRLFDGSQVDFSGVPEHAPYVSLLDPDAIASFIQITHDRYAKEIGNDLGKVFVSTFTDEPSLIADYYVWAMPWAPIAWHPSLAAGFTKRTGRQLTAELPLLFLDGPGAARTRYDFWLTVAEQLRTNYFERIRIWCKAHNIPSGGHLLLEEDLREHVPLYGDFFACLREMDVPGIDVLSLVPAQSPWYTARLASSAGELEGSTLVMSETSDFSEMMAKPPIPVSLEQFRGTINRLLLGGINRFNSYSGFRDLSVADINELNLWTGRACMALTGGARNARIGVLYPIQSAWPRFKPSKHQVTEAGPMMDRLAQIYQQVNNLLYEHQREFSHIDTRTLLEAKISQNELQYHRLAFSVVVLPDTDTLPADAWRNLERFWENGGVVIAAGSLPLDSERDFPSAAAKSCAIRMFGTPKDAKSPCWASNTKGGYGIYLPPHMVNELPAVLDAVLGRDVVISNPTAPVRITRRVIDGHDVFLIINDSPKRWRGGVTICQPARAAEMCNLATGEITPLPNPAQVVLSLEAYGAVIVRQELTGGVPRLYPKTLDLHTKG